MAFLRLFLAVLLLVLAIIGCSTGPYSSPTVVPHATMPTLDELLQEFNDEFPWVDRMAQYDELTPKAHIQTVVSGGLISDKGDGHIEPGLYVAETPGTCFWETKGLGTEDRRGGAYDWLSTGEERTRPVYAEIYPTDYAFSSRGCGRWTKVR